MVKSGKVKHGGAKRLILMTPVPTVDARQMCSDVLDRGGWKDISVFGACANHNSEAAKTKGYTEGVLIHYPDMKSLKDAMANATFELQVERDPKPHHMDYSDITVVKQGSVHYPGLHRLNLVKHKNAAALAKEYAAVAEKEDKIKMFEYAKLNPADSGGYDFIFMSLFASAADRDAVLSKKAHADICKKIADGAEQHCVFDFFEEDAPGSTKQRVINKQTQALLTKAPVKKKITKKPPTLRKTRAQAAAPGLIWECIKGGNSFMRKPNKELKRHWSAEPGNLLGVHAQRFSGIAADQVIDVVPVKDGSKERIELLQSHSKASRHRRPASRIVKVGLSKCPSKGLQQLETELDDKLYQRGLKGLAFEKYARIQASLKKRAYKVKSRRAKTAA